MKPAPRSCYVLELSVQPGGSRWAELHAYSDARHIQRLLKDFCKNQGGMSAYHAIWYGDAVLGIWVVQRGVVVKFINLYSYITAKLGRMEPLPLSRKAALKRLLDAHCEEDDDDGDELCEQIKLGLLWDALAPRLPALKEPRLAPGERGSIKHRKPPGMSTYLDEDGVLFGSVDAEAGERIEPPFKIRGWDPLAEEEEDDDE